ncbi:Protein N-acetyltransferase, RimJ/RimL family [Saccharopolyspora kobensis]|uniref:Protein N-acetyltransferase, RimJ/RimL family n=1 Tax=Saccharopolyspora kobensis TaxID=146035 RepID=A0A1H5VXI3_9PSEU|nr:GNAT family N-acetyltransferase [Saccharopolyspora kobensis]SEF91267.1 Protein N-acetyltransferase, RimJ/RimL family [Saccharopolyspora kobensis]SFC56406.1 Protein N-acetyltransferase, RimJ/RimL family [Saccharopolyspora kobensis]
MNQHRSSATDRELIRLRTLLEEPPALRSDRLDLEPLRADHAEEMSAVLASPELYEFIGGVPLTAAELRARYERMLAGSPDPEVSWCNWVIRLRAENRLVGAVQATIGPGYPGPAAEIAWMVGTGWQRRGIAKEAVLALVDWLRRLPVRGVLAHVHPRHRASAAVAEAAGLQPTADIHDGEVVWRLPFRD